MKQSNALVEKIFTAADAMNDEMVTRRRDLHKYAEPGWTEFRTAAMVAGELTKLGYAVEAGAAVVKKEAMMGVPSDERLAKEMERAVSEGADPQWVEKMAGGLTGVVGTMKCAGDGPVVALRFDMDALDLRETTDAGHEPLEKGFALLPHPSIFWMATMHTAASSRPRMPLRSGRWNTSRVNR